MSMLLSEAFVTRPALAEAMGDCALIAGVFSFESALAQAQALEGLIPEAAAAIISQAASQITIAPGDVARDAANAGTLAIPLVAALTAEVRRRDPSAAAFVHFGATSQDALDTALVLQLDQALALVDADLARLAAACAEIADKHRLTVMLGRTLLQPATPIAFGQKAAQWLLAVCEDRERIREAARAALRIQFGGAAGNLGSLADKGPAVSGRLASLLPMRFAAMPSGGLVAPWHTRRGHLLSLCSALTIATASAAKIARDISLMAQWEVGEAAEPAEAGRGGSSAMPHKRNPVLCMATISAGVRAPGLLATLMSAAVQEHERALGGWQAEWAVLPEIVKLSGGAFANMADAISGLVIDPARMRANLDSLNGLPLAEMAALALAPRLGRDKAHALVAAASKRVTESGSSLADEIARDPIARTHLSDADLAAIFDPARALGATSRLIDDARALWLAQESEWKQ